VPSIRTRAFVDALGAGLLLFGAAARARLHAGSPLPSGEPVLWFLLGAAGDLAVFGLAGALLLGLCRTGLSDGAARKVLASFAVGFGALLVLWSEAVLYFGHAPRRQDFAIAGNASFLRNSLDGALAFRILAAVLVLVVLVAVSAAWARQARRAWSSPARLGVAGACAFALALAPVRIHNAQTARNPVAVVVALAREGQEAPAPAVANLASAPEDDSVRSLVRASGPRYLDPGFPLAMEPEPRTPSAPRLPAGVRPNVVFLVMEGVRSEEVGAYGGTVPNLTPNLDRLAREGVRIDRAYSTGTRTPEGELALWYGLLALPRTLVMTNAPETSLTGLPELLRAAGWRDFLWMHNGDQTFYGRDRFLLPRGFRSVDGRDFNPRDPRTNWGFSDRSLALRAIDAFDRLEPPFAAMMLTVSNHHPFAVPDDAQSRPAIGAAAERGFLRLPGLRSLVGRHTVPMLETVHYTDEAVGLFFERARSRPWFAQTVFVVTGDHGLPIAALDGKMTLHRLEELRHRVPLVFYAPGLLTPDTRPGPASLADIPPTLLGLLGIAPPRAGVGCDLLDPGGCDPARPVVTWNDEAQMVTLVSDRFVYHRVAAGEGAEEEWLAAPGSDAFGARDLSADEGAVSAELRRLSDVYLNVYPRVVLGGRSGLPPPGAQ
jgi:fumarate reductase subunit D